MRTYLVKVARLEKVDAENEYMAAVAIAAKYGDDVEIVEVRNARKSYKEVTKRKTAKRKAATTRTPEQRARMSKAAKAAWKARKERNG